MNFNISQKDSTSEKSFSEFVNLVSLLEPIEFLGLTKIFCVKLLNEDLTQRDFEELLSDVLDGYLKVGCDQRRQVLKVLRKTTKGRGHKNGTPAKNPTE
jgi:hypothetical protein